MSQRRVQSPAPQSAAPKSKPAADGPQAADITKAMPGRTPLFNVAATTAVWGMMLVAYAFQDNVHAAFDPIYQSVEHSTFAYILCFVMLLAMPEPSPFVALISFLLVWFPPRTAWSWVMSSLEDYQKVVWMMTSVFVVAYWTNGLLLMALEHFCAKQLDVYRIQKEKKAHSRPSTGKLLRNIAINTCIVPVIALVIGLNVSFKPSDFEIPGPFEICLSASVGALVNEVFFFYGHWLMHANKWLYGNIHKVHHEFKSPCALAAVYCHPVELVLSDFMPLGAGIVLFNKNLYFAAVFTTFAVLGTQTHHCGFRWPWIARHGNQPDFHDYHHEKFTCNYGNVGFLDALHGTGAGSRFHPVEVSPKVAPGKEAAKAA